jgi:hypothetical protein
MAPHALANVSIIFTLQKVQPRSVSMKHPSPKTVLLVAASALSFCFFACGDSSTGPGDSSVQANSYKMVVDAGTQTIQLSSDGEYESKCLIKDGTAEWGQVKTGSGNAQYQYRFIGDTLALFLYDQDDYDYKSSGQMYTGGSAGNIYGTWTSIPCKYNSSREKTSCDDDESATEMISISGNSFSKTVTTKYIEETNRKFNYATSAYRYNLFAYLVTGTTSYIPLPDYIFRGVVTKGDEYVKQGGNLVSYAELYANYPLSERISMGLHSTEEIATFGGIVSTDLSATGETFIYGGIPYTVSVLKAIDTDEHTSITVTIATNEITCTGIDESNRHITQDLCKSENMEYLTTDDDTDVNGNKYYYGYIYSQNNFSEFKACLNSIIIPLTAVQ